ncbi:MAG: hypothetical protein IJR68_07585 [Fretibacterium sp.]|nr:hypothetical protein [Fretibacterium sp.]
MSVEGVILILAVACLSVAIFFCLVRAVLGPRMTDRLVAVNIISIKAVVLILLIGRYLRDDHFMDIALVYTLLSFLAVICIAENMLARTVRRGEGKETADGTV